jgi:hypothetical protein
MKDKTLSLVASVDGSGEIKHNEAVGRSLRRRAVTA